MPSIADQLRAIADQLDAQGAQPPAAPAVPEPAVPSNWVRIRPPFPRGQKYRDYPDPQFVSNFEGKQVTTLSGYASSAQEAWKCPHFDYKTQGGRLLVIGNRLNAMLKKEGGAAYPRALDEIAFPLDYIDPAKVAPDDPNAPPWISRPGQGSTV